jgi:hypothetical protein
MHYQLSAVNETDTEVLAEVWADLQTILSKNGNAPGIHFSDDEGQLTAVDATWGVVSSEDEDMKELSAAYPDLVLRLVRVSDVLNSSHFDQLKNFSAKEFERGRMKRSYQPAAVDWQKTWEADSLFG